MGPVKDSDLLKTVRDNNRSKFLKLLSPEKGFSVSKVGIKQDSSIPGGRIRLKLTHVNVNCHEEKTGYTPLIISVLNGNKDMFEDLIFHSVDVDGQDSKGNTALHMAVFAGKGEIVELLMNNKAKANIQNSDGNTPLHIACQADHDSRVHIMLKLIQHEASTELRNKDGNTPLDVAAMYSKADAVSLLLDNDHDKGISPDQAGPLPMIQAAIRGYRDVVEMLLDYGYNPNSVDEVKDTTALAEAVRFLRYPVAETLLKYGANPDQQNSKKESPVSVANSYLPKSEAEKFNKMFKAAASNVEDYGMSGPTETPRFLKILRGASLQARKDFPQLPNNVSWTRNTPEYCNSCTPNAPNTNILDDDLCKCWIAAEVHHAWTVLDLKYNHTLTGITIYGWDSPRMVKSFQLQRGGTVEGPWSQVITNSCIRSGNTDIKEIGLPQTFTDFTATSRYWRLELLDNHGGDCICFQGIKLFGADERIRTLLEENSVDQYADDIIDLGYNYYKKFLLIQDSELKQVVSSEEDRKTILKSLDRDRPKEFHPVSLSWVTTPIVSCKQGEALPAFSIKSSPGVKTKVQLKPGPGVEVTGSTVVMLQSDSFTEPSIATFEGITYNTVGRHRMVISCVEFPRITVESPQTIEIIDNEFHPEMEIEPKTALRNSVAMAFDDMEAMLNDLTASLDPVKE